MYVTGFGGIQYSNSVELACYFLKMFSLKDQNDDTMKSIKAIINDKS